MPQKTAFFWISSVNAYNCCVYGESENVRRGPHSVELEGGRYGRLDKIAVLIIGSLA